LPDIVRPRTRCERDESVLAGKRKKPRALVSGRLAGFETPAAGLSRSGRALGFASRRRRRFALSRDLPAGGWGKNGASNVSVVTSRHPGHDLALLHSHSPDF